MQYFFGCTNGGHAVKVEYVNSGEEWQNINDKFLSYLTRKLQEVTGAGKVFLTLKSLYGTREFIDSISASFNILADREEFNEFLNEMIEEAEHEF
jgi:hypothetical protein